MKSEWNNRENFEAVYNASDDICGNEYPMTAQMLIEDSEVEVVVLTDHPQRVIS
jgi:hypothetical protein